MANKNDERKTEIAAAETPKAEVNAKTPEGTVEALEDKGIKPAKITAADLNPSGIWCYIGPNLRGLINHNKIFRGTRAEVLKQAGRVLEAYPEAQRLIVSGENLTRDRERAGTPGNALYETCQALEKKEKEGRKE